MNADPRASFRCAVCERDISTRWPDGSLSVAYRIVNAVAGRMTEVCPQCNVEMGEWMVQTFRANRDPFGIDHKIPKPDREE